MCRQVMPGEPWFEGCLSGVGDCAHATPGQIWDRGAPWQLRCVSASLPLLTDCLLSPISLGVEQMSLFDGLNVEQ